MNCAVQHLTVPFLLNVHTSCPVSHKSHPNENVPSAFLRSTANNCGLYYKIDILLVVGVQVMQILTFFT